MAARRLLRSFEIIPVTPRGRRARSSSAVLAFMLPATYQNDYAEWLPSVRLPYTTSASPCCTADAGGQERLPQPNPGYRSGRKYNHRGIEIEAGHFRRTSQMV